MATKTGKGPQHRPGQTKSSRTEVPISGMTCRACEVRIAKALGTLPGVTSTKVSATTGVAVVNSTRPLDPKAVSKVIEAAGYAVGQDPRRWLSRDRQTWVDLIFIVAIVAVIVMFARMHGFGRFADNLSKMATSGNLVFVMLLGVAASISTCMALVGGLVMSLSARFTATHPLSSRAGRLRPQVMFNIGRIVGFTALGALIGVAGSAISLSGTALALAMIVVAIVMAVLGIKLTGISPRLAAMALTLPPALTNWMRRGQGAEQTYGDSSALLLGAASFFLPCGFTQAVQIYALSTGSPIQSGLVMGLFAIGTTPGLMGVGAVSAFAKGPSAARVFRVVGVVVIGFAIFNLTGALSSLGLRPGSSPVVATSSLNRTDNVTDTATGQQVLTTVAGGYQPNQTVVYANSPITWVLESSYIGCDSTINASSLGVNEPIYLEPGTTTVELPPLAPGTYNYTCAMGMFRASITAVERPNPGPGSEPAPS